MMRTDNELVADFIGGESAAFDELHSRHQYGLRKFVRKHRRNSDWEDIVQSTWVRAMKYAHNFEHSRSKFFTWLLNIAWNEIVLARKKETEHNNFLAEYADRLEAGEITTTVESAEDRMIDFETSEMKMTLVQAAAMIEHDRGVPILEEYLKGSTHLEIAGKLNISRQRVTQILGQITDQARKLSHGKFSGGLAKLAIA